MTPSYETNQIALGLLEKAERKREVASVLGHIKPVSTIALATEARRISEFSIPFNDYVRAFELAWAEGDMRTDVVLADQLDRDQRLDETERSLLFEARAEIALRDLEAFIAGVFTIET